MILSFKGCRTIRTWALILVLFSLEGISPLLSQNIIHKDIDSLGNIPITEISLKNLREIIFKKMGLDPKTSLEYISLYEDLILSKEDNQEDIEKVNELRGGAYNQMAWSAARSNKELALSYIDSSQI